MITVHIDHKVSDYRKWKEAFDSDPMQRQKSGVRAYRIEHGVQEPNHIVVDLDFDDMAAADRFLGKLQDFWTTPQATALLAGGTPRAEVMETVETKAL